MGAVERIEAAIQKLEELKDESSDGPWEWVGDMAEDEATLVGADGDVIVAGGMHTQGFLYIEPCDAELIVTLHRTIDAQLAILRDGLEQARAEERYPHYWYAPPKDGTLALANAILGDPS